jgi:formate hydrogenlyase subunit 3/multisubunit Na+/H+ antiporter MnhD subunit
MALGRHSSLADSGHGLFFRHFITVVLCTKQERCSYKYQLEHVTFLQSLGSINRNCTFHMFLLLLLHTHYMFRPLLAIFKCNIYIYTSYFTGSYFSTTDPLLFFRLSIVYIFFVYFYLYIYNWKPKQEQRIRCRKIAPCEVTSIYIYIPPEDSP